MAELKRNEAVSLLKELINSGLAAPTVVSLDENKHGKFDLKISGDYSAIELKAFLAKKKLTVLEDKAKAHCTIYKR